MLLWLATSSLLSPCFLCSSPHPSFKQQAGSWGQSGGGTLDHWTLKDKTYFSNTRIEITFLFFEWPMVNDLAVHIFLQTSSFSKINSLVEREGFVWPLLVYVSLDFLFISSG